MHSLINSYFHNFSIEKDDSQAKNLSFILKFSKKNERKILKAFLIASLYKVLGELFKDQMKFKDENFSMECHIMDSKIIQFLLHEIVETGEYTLEGIAYYTHIPFDVIYEAACGINNQFSATPWAKVVDLYMQVKPDTTKILIEKLLEIINKNTTGFSSLLKEE
jgi:hypothetical protein